MAFTEGICEDIQQTLNDTTPDKPSLKRTRTGYLEALQSQENTAGVQKVAVDPDNGKKKTVRLTYIKRASDETEIITTKITDCGTSKEPTPFEDFVEVDQYIGTPGIKFDRAQMRKLCGPDKSYMRDQINAHIDYLIRKFNKTLIATQALNFGVFNGGDSYKTVVLLKGNNEAPNYQGEAKILEAFEDLDTMGRPILIGSGNLGLYARQAKIGCCNADGLDLSQSGSFAFYRDRFVEGIVGDHAFIGLVPGMVQLLTWNEYVGDYVEESPTFSHGTIVDPVTGLKFDMRWHFNDCDDTYSVNLGLWYKLHHIPSDSFEATDEFSGYNGSLKFVGVAMDDYGCCA